MPPISSLFFNAINLSYVTLSFNTPIGLFLLQPTTPFDRIVELLVKGG